MNKIFFKELDNTIIDDIINTSDTEIMEEATSYEIKQINKLQNNLQNSLLAFRKDKFRKLKIKATQAKKIKKSPIPHKSINDMLTDIVQAIQAGFVGKELTAAFRNANDLGDEDIKKTWLNLKKLGKIKDSGNEKS